MGIETFLIWLVVGLVAGLLAAYVVGGGFGLLGDIVVGLLGAIIGGWIFSAIGVESPVGGIIGAIIVAFIGAVVLLAALRAIRSATHRGSPRRA